MTLLEKPDLGPAGTVAKKAAHSSAASNAQRRQRREASSIIRSLLTECSGLVTESLYREASQPRAGQNGDQEGRQMKGDEGRQGGSGSQEQPRMEIMKGDKAAAASGPFSDFGDQQPSYWEVRTPIASSYLGNEGRQMKKGD